MRKHKFSVPFDASNIKDFLSELGKRYEYVHDVFVALPGFLNYFTKTTMEISPDYEKVCHNFLMHTEGLFKRFVPLNADYDAMDYDTMHNSFLPALINALKSYKIDGVICSNYYMALKIREALPDIAIETSCNAMHWTTAIMKSWQRNIGIEAFNVPREAGRNLPWLQELHEQDIPIKLLLNEQCSPFCPYMAGFCAGHHDYDDSRGDCYINFHPENPRFRNCVVLPRWLDKLDDIVEVYKITGRYVPPKQIWKTMDAYIAGKDCQMSDIVNFDKKHFEYSTAELPDKLLYCGFNDCDTKCSLCNELNKKLSLQI